MQCSGETWKHLAKSYGTHEHELYTIDFLQHIEIKVYSVLAYFD